MKTAITMILTIFLFSCGTEPPEIPQAPPIITDTTPPPVDVTDPPPATDPGTPPVTPPVKNAVVLALKSGSTLKFYDGETIFTWKTGKIARGNPKFYSHENILYELDDFGDTVNTWNLIDYADFLILSTDKWVFQQIDPQTALDSGAQYKDYTKIYQNSTEYGTWSMNKYKTESVYSLNSDIFTQDSLGKYLHINGSKINIRMVTADFVLHNYNSTTRTAKINTINVSWSTNYFNSATEWIKSGSTWYGHHGYTWNGTILNETGSSLTDWRTQPYLTGYTESPVLIAAGSHFNNSEDEIYFLECNSGWLIKYIPSTNQHSLHVRLYLGDGLRSTGLFYKKLLKPIIIGDYLYIVLDANIYRYNFLTGLTGHFASGVDYVMEY